VFGRPFSGYANHVRFWADIVVAFDGGGGGGGADWGIAMLALALTLQSTRCMSGAHHSGALHSSLDRDAGGSVNLFGPHANQGTISTIGAKHRLSSQGRRA